MSFLNLKKNAGHFLLLAILSVIIVSCKKPDPGPASPSQTYLVMSNSASRTYGAISTYDVATSNFGPTAYHSKGTTGNPFFPFSLIADLVPVGGKIYVVGKYSATLDVINPAFYTIEKTISFGKWQFTDQYKHIAASSGKIFVSDQTYGNLAPRCFLKVIDIATSRVDSVGISDSGSIFAMTSVDNKVFVSWYSMGVGYVSVFDAASYARLATVTLSVGALHLIKAKGFVYAQSGRILTKINSTDFSKTEVTFSAGLPDAVSNGTNNNAKVAIDEDKNVIYYLNPEIQGYSLRSFDLNSGVSSVLNTQFIAGTTIGFDPQKQVIIVGIANFQPGDRGTVALFDVQGKQLNTFTMPDIPEKILLLQ